MQKAAISGTFAIERNVCRGYYLSHRSSLAVSGRNISRVLQLHKEIVEYYSTKNKGYPLPNNDFAISLAFLVDFLTHVNNLNKSLQGKGTTVCFMH